MNEKFLSLLKNIDLTKTQIKIYQAVMKLGMPTVFELGEYLKLNRPRIYKEANELLEKGILELGANKPRKFLAVNPRRIKSLIEEKKDKLQMLESCIDDAEKYFQNRTRKVENEINLKIFEDKNIKKVYEMELEDAKDSEILIISGPTSYMDKYFNDEYFEYFVNKARKNKLRIRALAHPSDVRTVKYFGTANYHNSQVRVLENLDVESAIDIWSDKTAIATFTKDKARVVLMENKITASTYRKFFNMLWKVAE